VPFAQIHARCMLTGSPVTRIRQHDASAAGYKAAGAAGMNHCYCRYGGGDTSMNASPRRSLTREVSGTTARCSGIDPRPPSQSATRSCRRCSLGFGHEVACRESVCSLASCRNTPPATTLRRKWGLNYLQHQDGVSYCWPLLSGDVISCGPSSAAQADV